MYDINQVTLIGRLTRDPEMKVTQAGKNYVKFGLAVGEGKDKVSFFNVTAWDKTADSVGQYMKKGSQICVQGKLKQDRWQDKEGQAKTAVSINAFTVQFLGGKSDSQAQPPSQTGQVTGSLDMVTGQEVPF